MTASPKPVRSARRTRQLRLFALGFGVLFALLATEVLFHLAPRLLPAGFRLRYPPNGVEFSHRGVLDHVACDELPLPYGVESFDGPPPHDIVDFGVAGPADAAIDRALVPRLVVPADVDGLPNRARPEHADVVLVGDSFTLFAGQEQPAGLERELPATCRNVAVSGIGPDHELFLLRQRGLPAKPKLVLWFFYAGNDVLDSFFVQLHKKDFASLGQLWADKRAPFLILPHLVASWFRAKPGPIAPTPLPPFELAAATSTRFWFYPNTLRMLAAPPEFVLGNPGWLGVTTALQKARDAVTSTGATLLVVYLPSKEEVYLPYVKQNGDLLLRTAQAADHSLVAIPMADTQSQLLADLMARRHTQEDALRAFCEQQHVPFWSAAKALDEVARRGEFVYYATDTHWRAEGQLAILPGLLAAIRQLGVFPR